MSDIITDKPMNEGMIRIICLAYYLNKGTYSIFLGYYHIHHVQISNFHLEEEAQSELSSRSIHIFPMMNMEHESHPVEQKDNTNCLSEDNSGHPRQIEGNALSQNITTKNKNSGDNTEITF